MDSIYYTPNTGIYLLLAETANPVGMHYLEIN